MFAIMLKVENFKWDMVRTHKSSVFRITSLDKFFVLMKKGDLRNLGIGKHHTFRQSPLFIGWICGICLS
jgi:hypothetical protein